MVAVGERRALSRSVAADTDYRIMARPGLRNGTSLHIRVKEESCQNQLLRNRESHPTLPSQQLSVSRRKATNLPGSEVFRRNQNHLYPATRKRCRECVHKYAGCHQRTLSARRNVTHIHEAARQRARERTTAPAFAAAQRAGRPESRSTFAELKNQIGLRRVRLRRIRQCSRTVLSRGCSREPETTGPLPPAEDLLNQPRCRSEIKKKARYLTGNRYLISTLHQ